MTNLNVVGFLVALGDGKHKLVSWEAVDPEEIDVELVEPGSPRALEPCETCSGSQGSPFAPEGFVGGTCPVCGVEGGGR